MTMHNTNPTIGFILSSPARSAEKMSIDSESRWRMPKYISAPSKFIIGIMTAVTTVSASAMHKRRTPRLVLSCDRREDMPDITMNSAAKNGSAGVKKSSSFVPISKPKNSDIL